MASVAVSALSPTEKEQLAIGYAAFVLSGSGAQVNQDSLASVLKAANIAVSAGLLKVVAKTLKGRNVSEFFGSVGIVSNQTSALSSSSAPQKAVTKPTQTKAPKLQQKKSAPPQPPADEEQAMDMGGLFD